MAAILSTSFAAPVTDWAASWSLASVTGVQVGHLCAAESELAQITKVGPGTTVTVRRGVEGTASAAHATSTPVTVSVAGEVAPPPPVSAAAIPLRQSSVVLSHDQIRTLPVTPVPVIGAPGQTRMIVPISAVLIGTYTTGYSGINAWADLTFRWRVGGLAAGGLMNRTSPALADVSTFLASPSQWTQVTFGLVRNIGAVTSAVGLSVFSVASLPPVNEVFELAGYDDGGATTWAGGHAANTIRATVTYVLFDTSLGRFV